MEREVPCPVDSSGNVRERIGRHEDCGFRRSICIAISSGFAKAGDTPAKSLGTPVNRARIPDGTAFA